MAEAGRQQKRVLIFVVAYNAERTIQSVLRRIPASLAEHETEILIIDDASRDRTFELAHEYEAQGLPFRLSVLFNPENQGYGGNQKLGFHYAIRQGFDIVALVHGDGQYAPEELPRLLEPLLKEEVDAVFGSRMLSRLGALKGGMPLYKYVGNKTLTWFQNRVLRSSLSEFHSGYRLYSVSALASIPFDLNTDDFHFDTEIIIQLFRAGFTIRELPIPTFYGDEVCHVNGLRYAWDVFRASLLARAQDFGILYERKYDVTPRSPARVHYQEKLGYESPHTLALRRIEPGEAVLGIGWSSLHLAEPLKAKGCPFTGLDHIPVAEKLFFEDLLSQHCRDLQAEDRSGFKYLLLLDVIEHLRFPEEFVESLRRSTRREADTTVIATTGNIGFLITRLMLGMGFFNYGVRGILDRTHMRLFTFRSLRHLFRQAGYRIEEIKGIPAPFPLALGNGRLARFLLAVNKVLIRISKTFFSYQIFLVARPLPSIEWLLQSAADASSKRVLAGRASSEARLPGAVVR